MSFQLSWISFFTAFVATFAAAPLIPVIRDNIDLTKQDLSAGAIASVTGAVFSRIIMGVVCDGLGPRYGHGVVQLMTSSATFCMAFVTTSTGFIIVRLCIGFSLATFVACQYWCSTMFSPPIVGSANAVAAGWGNAGAGVTHLITPYIFSGFENLQPAFIAWRITYFIPAFAQVIVGLACLIFGQDAPDGQFADLKAKGEMNKAKSHLDMWAAVKNYRTWIMVLTYGYCFGVELTVDNNIAPYLHDTFDIELHEASVLGAVFGLSNLFARALGGIASDLAAKRWGMRGRLWTLWIVQSLGGVCSLCMYPARNSLGLTMFVVVCWSIFVPMACGASFGVAPFITRRGLGVATGLIGSGGNAGSSITQAIFFTSAAMTLSEGFLYMGIMILAVTLLLVFIKFPMWGSMFTKGDPTYNEEDYYIKDFTLAEREKGLHRSVLKFANESRSNRGFKKALEGVSFSKDSPSKVSTTSTDV